MTSAEERQNPRNTTVVRLGLVSMFADISSEMLYPITPIFLTMVLGSSMVGVGTVEGVAEAVASLLKVASGRWSDRLRRRKPFMFIGYLLAALAKPLTGMAGAWTDVLVARSADRFGKGIRGAPRDALIAESVAPEFRGRAFGFHRSLDTLGAIIGPMIAIGLIALLGNNLRMAYFLAFIPGIVAALLVLTVRERPHIPAAQSATTSHGLMAPLSNRSFVLFLVSWTIFSLGNSSDVFLILRAKSLGFSTAQTVLLYCLYNFIFALSAPYLGGLADRMGKMRVMAGGWIIFALVYAGFALCQDKTLLIGLFAIYGLFAAATDGISKAVAVDLVSADFKATSLGWLGTVTGFAALAANILAGGLWDRLSPAAPFWLGTGAAVAALGVVALGALSSRK